MAHQTCRPQGILRQVSHTHLIVYLASCHGYCCYSITVEEAKEVHRSLKLAAGMFLRIKEQLLPKLPATPEKGTDFDVRVVEAYAAQSQAEAQEGMSRDSHHGQQSLSGCVCVLQ